MEPRSPKSNKPESTRAEGSGVPFEATDEQRRSVKTMAAFGVPQAEISRALQIDVKTLRKHFREVMDQAVDQANAKMAETLYKAGINGSVGAMIFWLKARANWRERHEITGPEGGVIPIGQITIVHVAPKKK